MAKIVNVKTTATIILDLRREREEYKLQNQGAATVYLGHDEYVTTSGTRKGRQLAAGVLESSNKQDDPRTIGKPLWGIVAAGSVDVWIDDH